MLREYLESIGALLLSLTAAYLMRGPSLRQGWPQIYQDIRARRRRGHGAPLFLSFTLLAISAYLFYLSFSAHLRQ